MLRGPIAPARPWNGYSPRTAQLPGGGMLPPPAYAAAPLTTHGGRTAAVRPRRGSGCLTALVILMVLVFGVVLVTVTLGGAVSSGARPAPQPSAAAPGGVREYSYGERANYTTTVSLIDDRIATLASTTSVWGRISQTPTNVAAALACEKLLSDARDELEELRLVTSTNTTELDEVIAAFGARADTWWQNLLAEQPLGDDIAFEQDGGTFVYNGTTGEATINDKVVTNGPTREELEQAAQAIQPQRGDDGTFAGNIVALADAFGVNVSWGDGDLRDYCTAGNLPDEDVVATFCAANPDTIYFNVDNPDFASGPSGITGERIVDSMKHELAHRTIFQQCKSTRPPIAQGRTEAVTNSYAVLYFGADRGRLNDNMYPEYDMSEESDAIAQSIHAGDCG